MSDTTQRAEGKGAIVLALRSPTGATRRDGFLHRIAGFELWSPVRLVPWAVPGVRPAARARPAGAAWKVVHDGPGLDLGELRRVVALESAAGQHRFDYDDGESFVVDPGGGWIEHDRPAGGGAAGSRSLERALGAPLVLALAMRGVYALHASAIVREGGAIALTAAPGIGKSTLAAAAERFLQTGWRRISDDLLPVRLGSEAEALPRFPQSKLLSSEQYPAESPERVPLRALVVLERKSVEARPVLDRIAAAGAAIAFAEATVAARWFGRELLARHLAACAAAAGTVRVARLTYPSGPERLEEILLTLARELG